MKDYKPFPNSRHSLFSHGSTHPDNRFHYNPIYSKRVNSSCSSTSVEIRIRGPPPCTPCPVPGSTASSRGCGSLWDSPGSLDWARIRTSEVWGHHGRLCLPVCARFELIIDWVMSSISEIEEGPLILLVSSSSTLIWYLGSYSYLLEYNY